MLLIAIAGGLLLACGLIIRELQLSRERSDNIALNNRLRRDLDATRSQLLRVREDLYLLTAGLDERNVITERELVKMRSRLIDGPRRRARERKQLTQDLDAAASHLIVDEGESVH